MTMATSACGNLLLKEATRTVLSNDVIYVGVDTKFRANKIGLLRLRNKEDFIVRR